MSPARIHAQGSRVRKLCAEMRHLNAWTNIPTMVNDDAIPAANNPITTYPSIGDAVDMLVK